MVNITPKDRPLRRDEQITPTISETFPFVPGAGQVIKVPRRSTEWYCRGHQGFIVPVMIRRGQEIFPSCMSCFKQELIEHQSEPLGKAI